MPDQKERFLILTVLLSLTAIFIAYLGPVITGNIVKNTQDVSLADFPYPFVKNHLLNEVQILVPDEPTADELLNAHQIARSLEEYTGVQPAVTLASQAEHEGNQIIITTDCTAFPLPREFCDEPGHFFLHTDQHRAILIIYGHTGKELERRTSTLLKNNYMR